MNMSAEMNLPLDCFIVSTDISLSHHVLASILHLVRFRSCIRMDTWLVIVFHDDFYTAYNLGVFKVGVSILLWKDKKSGVLLRQ